MPFAFSANVNPFPLEFCNASTMGTTAKKKKGADSGKKKSSKKEKTKDKSAESKSEEAYVENAKGMTQQTGFVGG